MALSNQKLFVTGAGGHLGRLVVEHLIEQGALDIVAGTPQPGQPRRIRRKGR